MKLDTNEILQWAGAVFIIAGHSLNAVGPAAYPYNILAFFVGTILFLIWTVRVANKPQMAVMVGPLAVALVIAIINPFWFRDSMFNFIERRINQFTRWRNNLKYHIYLGCDPKVWHTLKGDI